MTHHTGSVPDTPRAADWRDPAACREEDPELFFPKGYEGPWQGVIDDAKAVCRRCPSTQACLKFALHEDISDGIFGGLTAKERDNLRRQTTRRNLTPQAIAARAEQRKPRTLQSIFNACTANLDGGHLVWDGPRKVHFGGMIYTPKQVCFTADRGHRPDGQLRSDCGVTECVLPRHLIDTGERSQRAASVKAHA